MVQRLMGRTSSALEGWDNPDSKYLYYGGAGLKMLDGHLVFTANGANAKGQPTVYWFAINSEVAVPKIQVKNLKSLLLQFHHCSNSTDFGSCSKC